MKFIIYGKFHEHLHTPFEIYIHESLYELPGSTPIGQYPMMPLPWQSPNNKIKSEVIKYGNNRSNLSKSEERPRALQSWNY